MSTPTPQTNGHPPPSSNSQTLTQPTQSQSQPANGTSQTTLTNTQPIPPSQPPTTSLNAPSHPHPSTTAPRPRDARTLELLLTAQGVTAYEARVPLLLLDFAYRHTASVLSDALHLAADPYTTHAGSKPSASAGAAASVPSAGDATVTSNAVQLAIAARLGYSFHGGAGADRGGAGGGGVSKEWTMELARERNRVALPKVAAAEWGSRLPGEKFVLSGAGWGLKDVWEGRASESEASEEEDGEDGGENVDVEMGGDGVEGGTMEDVFGREGGEAGGVVGEEDVDMEME